MKEPHTHINGGKGLAARFFGGGVGGHAISCNHVIGTFT